MDQEIEFEGDKNELARIEGEILIKSQKLSKEISNPITNFIRRLLHSSHKECRECWETKQAKKTS